MTLANTSFTQQPPSYCTSAGVHYGRNYAGWRYAPIDQINRESVGRLELVWKIDVREGVQHKPKALCYRFETTGPRRGSRSRR